MRIKTVLGLVFVLMFAQPVRAQSLSDLANAGCDFVNNTGVSGFEWVCYAAQLASNVETLLTSFHEDLSVFGQELYTSWLEEAFGSVGGGIDASQLSGVLATLNAAIAGGPAAFRQAVSDAVRSVRLSSRSGPPPPVNSPDWWYEEAIEKNPNLAAAEGILSSQENQLLETRGEAAVVHEMNVKLAEQVATSTAHQDAMARVLRPSVGGFGGGDAARLEDAVRTAVSTRSAVQVLTEGIADLMRHQAVFSGNLNESLRILAQQQVMTTWELQLAVNTLTKQLEREIAEERAALEALISQEFEAGEELGIAIQSIASGTGVVLAPDTESLRLNNLGW